MAAPEKHDALETAQLVVAIATGLIGLLYYSHRKAASAEAPTVTSAPTGPAGFGEVAGGGGGSFSPTSGAPAPPATGQQTNSAGGEEPAKVIPRYPGEGQTFGPHPTEPGPGEGQSEWERNRQTYEQTHARPLAAAGGRGSAASIGALVQARAA